MKDQGEWNGGEWREGWVGAEGSRGEGWKDVVIEGKLVVHMHVHVVFCEMKLVRENFRMCTCSLEGPYKYCPPPPLCVCAEWTHTYMNEKARKMQTPKAASHFQRKYQPALGMHASCAMIFFMHQDLFAVRS